MITEDFLAFSEAAHLLLPLHEVLDLQLAEVLLMIDLVLI